MVKLIKKFSEANPATKATMALLFANLVLKGLSLISGPVFTRIMTTEQYGLVSTFTSWQSMLAAVVTLNLSQGVFNNGMLDYKEDRDAFQFSLAIISCVTACIFFMVYIVGRRYFLELFEMPEIMVYIMFLHFLFVPSYSFWSGRQRYEFKYKLLTVITIGSAFLALSLGIAAVLFSPDNQDAIARVCTMEGVSISLGVVFFLYIALHAKFKFKWEYCKYALRFNVPLIPHYLSMYVLSSSDRIMITKMINTSATAIYSVAYTVASVINIFWQSLEASLSPWIYEKLKNNDVKPVKDLTAKVIAFFAVMCVGCTLFAPEIMIILAPSDYSEGVYAIPAVAAGVFFTAMYSLYMRIELFYKKTGFATIATTIAAVTNIILNYIFIRMMGYLAAGYTTMVCYALLALFHYFNVRHKGFSNILNNKAFLFIALIVIVLTVLITFVYAIPFVRYISIIILVLLLIYKRKEIISVIKKKI